MKSNRTTKYSRQMYEYNILLGRRQIQKEFDTHIIKLEKDKDNDKINKSFITITQKIKTRYGIKNTTKPERIFIQNYNKLNNKLK